MEEKSRPPQKVFDLMTKDMAWLFVPFHKQKKIVRFDVVAATALFSFSILSAEMV